MITAILKIRFSQLFRLLKEIGLFRIIFLLLILWFVFFIAYQFMILPENTIMSIIVIVFLFLSLHASRNDKLFIKTTIKSPYSILDN